MLGHPEVLRKLQNIIKHEDLEKESKTEKVSVIQYQGLRYEFIELAPEVFHAIRRIQNVDE